MRALTVLYCLFLATALLRPALAHEERLAGGEWVLMGGSGTAGPAIRFESGRVSGSGGCNRFGGRYDQRGDSLRFSPLAATRMACATEVMRREQAFFDMLAKVRRFELSGESLKLLDPAGEVLATLAHRVAN